MKRLRSVSLAVLRSLPLALLAGPWSPPTRHQFRQMPNAPPSRQFLWAPTNWDATVSPVCCTAPRLALPGARRRLLSVALAALIGASPLLGRRMERGLRRSQTLFLSLPWFFVLTRCADFALNVSPVVSVRAPHSFCWACWLGRGRARDMRRARAIRNSDFVLQARPELSRSRPGPDASPAQPAARPCRQFWASIPVFILPRPIWDC